MSEFIEGRRNLVMGALAGQAALGVQSAALTLYETGGKEILAGATQAGLRKALHGSALNAVATLAPELLVQGAAETGAVVGPAVARSLAGSAAKAAVAETARAAGAQVLRGALRAGVVGLVVDGALGAYQSVRGYRGGTMTAKQACVHTATEASTGAASTAAGVALAAGVVALTGALAAPAVVAIGAGGALAAKLGLTRLLQRKPAAAETPAAVETAVVG